MVLVGYISHTDKSSPHLVHRDGAIAGAVLVGSCLRVGGRDSLGERVLETGSQAEHDQGTTELAKTLHGEHSGHHGTTPLGGSELGGNDTRKRVVTTDT